MRPLTSWAGEDITNLELPPSPLPTAPRYSCHVNTAGYWCWVSWTVTGSLALVSPCGGCLSSRQTLLLPPHCRCLAGLLPACLPARWLAG